MISHLPTVPYRFYLALVITLLTLCGGTTALAKEGFFNPALGEVVTSSPGLERAVVNQEGGLSLYANDGSLVSGYPLTRAGSVFVSSPLLVDVTNDGLINEIVVLGRDGAGISTLYAFASNRTLLASTVVTGTISFDPIVNGHDIYLTTAVGDVWSFTYANSSWTSTRLLALGQSGVIALARNRTKLLVSLPLRSEMWVFTRTGSAWTQTATVRLTSALAYTVIEDEIDTDIVYGVNTARQLIAFRQSTGRLLSGFPTALAATPVGGPTLIEGNVGNSNLEVVVPLSDGTSRIFSKTGQLLSTVATKNVGEATVIIKDSNQGGFFSSIHDFGVRISRSIGRTLTSVYSRIRIPASTASSTPAFYSLTVRPVVSADSRDVQVADLVLQAADVTHPGIDQATIIVNQTTNPTDTRGRFQYSPQRGFEEIGSNYFGNHYVTLLAQDAQNSSTGSQVLTNVADGLVHLIYRWTMDATYGDKATNTVKYGFVSGPYVVPSLLPEQTPQTTFRVNAGGSQAPVYAGVTVRPSILANNTDVQVVDIAFRVSDVTRPGLDTVTIMLDRSTVTTTDMRGRFQYTPQSGFEEAGGNYFGNQYVRLLPQNSSNSSTGSQVVADLANNTVHYIYRWVTDPSHGDRAVNTITYALVAGQYTVPAELTTSTFAVTH